MKRSIQPALMDYIDKKIVMLTGPRQVGKTTISKQLIKPFEYLNYDNEDHRVIFREKSWDRQSPLIIMDELHKMKKWKQWLKGVIDVEGIPPRLLITGSARMDTFRKVGDSLAGRYFQYRLHPLDLLELQQCQKKIGPEELLDQLMLVGGFPEPFFEGNKKFYNQWKKTHLDIILRQDLIETETVRDIKSIEILVELLQERVGSTISYSNLATDLQCSDKTIKRWLQILENMYVIFQVRPYSKNITKSILKQPKYYFYDIARVKNEAARFENLVACSLLKECHRQVDCLGEDWSLHYLAKKGQGEIDFALTKENEVVKMIEVKLRDKNLTANFNLFTKCLPSASKIQLVKDLKREKTFSDGTEIRRAITWLSKPFIPQRTFTRL